MAKLHPAAWLAAVVVLAAGASALAATRAPKTHEVVVDMLAFEGGPIKAHIGDVVEWNNRDLFQHSATATDHSFDVVLNPGVKGRATLKHAGIVYYYCRFHPGMKGQISVEK